MTTTTNQPHIPAGTISADDWEGGSRFFFGTTRVVETEHGNIDVELEGEQFADGRVRRFLYVTGHRSGMTDPTDGPMAVEDARKFGAALIAAADEQAQLGELDESGRGAR